MYVVICKIDHCIHIHWCIPMGLGHNDPWVESHMWPQQTWGQRSSRGQWPLVQVFGKKGQCIHILWCIFKSNITMIAKYVIAKAGETRGSRTALLSRRVYYKPSKITKLTVSKLLSLENDPNGENLALRKYFAMNLHPRCCWPTLTMESQRDIMVSAVQSQGCHFSGTLSQFVLYKRIAIYQLSGNFTPL